MKTKAPLSTKNQNAKTAGELSLEAQKSSDKIEAVEMQQEILKGTNSKKSFIEEIEDAARRGKNDPSFEGEFYVICLVKKERLLQNILRPYFFYRQSCPTPEFDQTVYKVTKSDNLEYLWTIPDVHTCNAIMANRDNLPPDHDLLIEMVNAFMNGDLEKYAKKLNKELINI